MKTPVSETGQTRKSTVATVRSASPPTPDIVGYISYVRKVPIVLKKSAAQLFGMLRGIRRA
jgi:hypothetical protein